MARIYVNGERDTIRRTGFCQVCLTVGDGERYEELEPRRLFPISRQNVYISLLDKNEREVALIRDLSELDEESQGALLACFDEYYRIPKIQRLLECEERPGVLKWRVETDRGCVAFHIRNRHHDIKRLDDGNRILIRDSEDNRYEIPDCEALDAHSRRLLLSYI